MGPMEEKIKRMLAQSTVNLPKEKAALIENRADVALDASEILGFLLVRERFFTAILLTLAREFDRREKEH